MLKLRVGVEALLLPSLQGERDKVAQFLQWAADRRRLSFRIDFDKRMPQFLIEGLEWTDCSSLSQLPWELPAQGISFRYADWIG